MVNDGNPGLDRRRLLTYGAALPTGGLFWLSGSPGQAQQAGDGPLQVDVRPTGVPASELEAVAQALQRRESRGRAAAPRNLRILGVRALDPEEFGKSASARAAAAGRWRALAYDYTSQRALAFEGRVGNTRPEREVATAGQPIPSPAEW